MIALYDVLVCGEVAYVGIAKDPTKRLQEHKQAGTAPDHATVSIVEWYATRRAALAAERTRIEDKKPPLNLVFMVKRKRGLAKQQMLERKMRAWDMKMDEFRRSYEKYCR